MTSKWTLAVEALAVDEVAGVGVQVEVEGGAVRRRRGWRGVLAGLVGLAADLLARQLLVVPGVVDGALRLVRGRALGHGGRADDRGQPAVGALEGVALQGAARGCRRARGSSCWASVSRTWGSTMSVQKTGSKPAGFAVMPSACAELLHCHYRRPRLCEMRR